MKSPVKTFLFPSLIFILLCGITFAQNIKKVNPTIIETESPLLNMKSVEQLSIIKTEESINQLSFEKTLYDIQLSAYKPGNKNIIPQLDIISSFRSNIRFGGFWDKYTIINFTPEMFVKPAEFISIYAIHSMSYFVPIDGIKQNFKSMALRSAAIMVVDNSVKLFLSASKIIGPVISFLAKNFLIYTINKMEKETDSKNNLNNFSYQYYSVSIRF